MEFCNLGHHYRYQLLLFKTSKVGWGWGPGEASFGSFLTQTVYKE